MKIMNDLREIFEEKVDYSTIFKDYKHFPGNLLFCYAFYF